MYAKYILNNLSGLKSQLCNYRFMSFCLCLFIVEEELIITEFVLKIIIAGTDT